MILVSISPKIWIKNACLHICCISLHSFVLKPDFANRPRLHAFEDFRYPDSNGEVPGLIFGNGESWRKLRRFTLKTMKDLGMGRRMTSVFIVEEMNKLCERYAFGNHN